MDSYDSGYWVRQRGNDGESIMNALQSREQGLKLNSIIAFTFATTGEFRERIEAKSAELKPGAWELREARVYAPNVLPQDFETYSLPTKLTRQQVAESFAAPDTVGFWHLPTYIRYAKDSGLAAAGYRLQYQFFWHGRSCRRRWCCWPPPSACVRSASAACRNESCSASGPGFRSMCSRRSPRI